MKLLSGLFKGLGVGYSLYYAGKSLYIWINNPELSQMQVVMETYHLLVIGIVLVVLSTVIDKEESQ